MARRGVCGTDILSFFFFVAPPSVRTRNRAARQIRNEEIASHRGRALCVSLRRAWSPSPEVSPTGDLEGVGGAFIVILRGGHPPPTVPRLTLAG